MKRYYVLIILALVIAGIFSFTQNADKSLSSLFFTAFAVAALIGVFFLFIDYILTIYNKHSLMKYFYVLVFLTFVPSFIPIPETITPIVFFIETIARFFFGIFVIIAVAAYFVKSIHDAKEEEEIEQASHAIHIFTKAYQRQKESKEPVEVQLYDFVIEKLHGYWKKVAK